MGLKLHTVAAARGLHWVRQGVQECFRHPLGYAGIFVMFMLAAAVLSAVPLVGGVALLMTVPLLSLAFLMATDGAQRGEPVHAGIFLAPWRGPDRTRQRSLLILCGAYALATLVVLALCNLIDGGRFDDLLGALSSGEAKAEEIEALIEQPGVREGVLARVILSALLSIPFWHAPALVQWGGQGPAQALFSSAMAVWQARGAFMIYGLGWFGALAAAGGLSSLLLTVMGVSSMAAVVMMPLALFFTTAFYASLHACFADSFSAADS
jgi:hypothetical protein